MGVFVFRCALIVLLCFAGIRGWGAGDSSDTRSDWTQDWPQFRGPTGQGLFVSKGVPKKWSESSNITWKTRIPGKGWSSPVIVGDRIWMTTALQDGTSLKLVELNKTTGVLVNEIDIQTVSAPGKLHQKNGFASPTPVVDGDRIFVHFGAFATACVDLEGKVKWKTRINYYHHHGPAASPILAGNRLIIPCDGLDQPFHDQIVRKDVVDFQFLVALDSDTGAVVWKQNRIQGRHAYATPLLIDVDGQAQVIAPGGDRVVAYSPETGDEIWSVRYVGYSLIPRPVYAHGLVFVCTGYDVPHLLAIKPDGKGDVTDSHVVWSLKTGVPKTPSPIVIDKELYFVTDEGIGVCLDAMTGKLHWKRRLGGNFSASPIAGDNKLYFQSEDGDTHVLVPGIQYKRLGVNHLSGMTYASPVVSGNSLFLRTDHALYRIDEKAMGTNSKASTSTPKPAR